MRMEQIESAVDRVMERRERARIHCRLMRAGELLPWTLEQLGWSPAQLRTDTVFVAEKDGKVCGLVIAAEVHGTLLLVRMLGSGGGWVRPLWRFIRHVCFQRQIAGVWMVAQNQNDSERKLLGLLPHFVDVSQSQEQSTILFGGRWNYAGTSSSPVVSTTAIGHRRGNVARNDGVHAGEPAGHAQDDDHRPHGGADGGAAGAAESGAAGAEREHAIADRREPDADRLCDQLGQCGWSAVRSQLHHAVFGRQWQLERADIGRHDDAEQLAYGRPE